MKRHFIFFFLFILQQGVCAQVNDTDAHKKPFAILVQWVDELPGDFSFTKNWSYPTGVEQKSDGRAGCADGGFCPQRCYGMLDSTGIVLKDSATIFYQLLDTTHLFHTIQCEAHCMEWAGTDFIYATQYKNGDIYCYTATDIATHSSLNLQLSPTNCHPWIELNSILAENDALYHGVSGWIKIDRGLWGQGILKAEFYFSFENRHAPNEEMYWKGKTFVAMTRS